MNKLKIFTCDEVFKLLCEATTRHYHKWDLTLKLYYDLMIMNNLDYDLMIMNNQNVAGL